MYIRRLHNAIQCLYMYICNACAIQSYACVCMSVILAQLLHNSVAKMCPGDDYSPRLLPGPCDPYLMEEHNHKHFKSLPRSLHIAYNFSNALKLHLSYCLPNVLPFERSDLIAGLSRDSLPNGRTSRGCARFNCYSPRRVIPIIEGFNTTCSYQVQRSPTRTLCALSAENLSRTLALLAFVHLNLGDCC